MKNRILSVLFVFCIFVPIYAFASYEDYVHVGYQVYKKGDPTTGTSPAWDSYTYQDVLSDMRLIRRHFTHIRTWTIQYSNQYVIQAAHECGVKVAMGAWAFPNSTAPDYFDEAKSKAEIDSIVAQAKQYPGTVTTIICGNENLADSPSPYGIIQANIEMLMTYARSRLDAEGLSGIKVTTCQTSGVWAGHGSLAQCASLDEVWANIYPFWHDNNPDDQEMTDYFTTKHDDVVGIAGEKKIVIGETGWATDGGTTWPEGNCKPSETNADKFFKAISGWFETNQVEGYIFEFFDEPWKWSTGMPQESHFGIFEGWNNNHQKYSIPTISSHVNIPRVRDYNGDDYSDIAFFDQSSGLWALYDISRVYYGGGEDEPVADDYDGDGTADVGIFRPSSGLWAIRGLTRVYFGASSDTGVSGDYDGDGTVEIGIFRDSSGLWAIHEMTRLYFGAEDDQPVTGDCDGNGTDDITIFRPDIGLWAIRGVSRFYFGSTSDTPLQGFFESAGGIQQAIFRHTTGLWAIRGVSRVYFGSGSDYPIMANLYGNSSDEIGIFRASSGLWAIRGVTRIYYGAP